MATREMGGEGRGVVRLRATRPSCPLAALAALAALAERAGGRASPRPTVHSPRPTAHGPQPTAQRHGWSAQVIHAPPARPTQARRGLPLRCAHTRLRLSLSTAVQCPRRRVPACQETCTAGVLCPDCRRHYAPPVAQACYTAELLSPPVPLQFPPSSDLRMHDVMPSRPPPVRPPCH